MKTKIVFIVIFLLYGSNSFAIKLDSSLVIDLAVFGMDVVAPDGSPMVVPSNATAVALNVTAVTPLSSGFITVWPCGVARPETSNVNYAASGIVPNGVIAPIGSGGKVCFYSLAETDLIVDVAGWFAGDAFVGITPSRLADTRTGAGGTLGRVGPDAPLVIQVSELNVSLPSGAAITVPANITTAALNVTIVNPISAGFVTVYPCDRVRPLASNVNYAADQIVANGVIAPVSESGTVCVYSSVLTDVVVDLAGWFAGSAFTGSIPTRLVDTRDGTQGKLMPSNELSVPVRGVSLSVLGVSQQVPDEATAVALNVTAVTPDGSGFITVYPCGVARPLASSLNFLAGDVVANNVMAPIGEDGAVCFHTSSPSDVVVDISGWFRGVPNNEFVGTTPKRLVDTRDNTGPTPVSGSDSDGDGVIDVNDDFPSDATESLDTNNDGQGNNADTDDDGDGVPDTADAFPLDASESVDTDADGTGNNADTDDDGDGVLDVNDDFPLDAIESLDTDNDGQGNNADTDDDGDGVPDTADAFPLDASESVDTDADGTGNNADTDDDGDGVDDTRDINSLDSSLTPPTAILTMDISEGPSPLLVSFNASSSIAGFGDDNITSYTWNFGDGDSSSGEVTSHIYNQVGSFEISLTLTNSDDLAHTATQTVTTSLVTNSLVIEGTIFVASSVTVDSDVNDSGSTPVSNNTPATAQFVTNPVTIGGFANEAGTGPNFDGQSNLTTSGDEFDVYRINALGGEVINLRIATRDEGDLDLLLYDVNGQLIDFSVSATDNESIVIPSGAATYDIFVESFSGYSNYVLSVGLDPAIASLSNASSSTAVVIGDLVVMPRNDQQAPRMRSQAQRVIGARTSARARAQLYQFGNNIAEVLAPRARAQTLRRLATHGQSMTELKLATMLAAKQLNRQDDVQYAEPNYLLTTKIEPNDELFMRQWHYKKINLPAAWNESTGSANVKIAVLDTGIAANHPDLQTRLSADSYDFISSVSNAGDGDGVDSDASDPGDGEDNTACSSASSRSSSFHGTHVAGTIGASTNNNIGTAGIAWAGEIMNLRVLGCGGGSSFDIAQALLYAAGVENALGILPTKAADVANLSLGGGSPSNVMNNAVQAAREAGLIIIAAAGNSGDSSLSYPASYDGVISVAATDLGDQRAFYSQFNASVDIAAPGGDTSADLDADGLPDGVLSTLANRSDSAQIDFNYGFYNGTSMAAPHVAGVVALMKSVNPVLTPDLVDQLISSGAISVDLGASGRDDNFGHGRIDALLAVQAAQQLADGTLPIADTPALGVSPSRVSFGATLTERNITLFNAGTGDLSISAFTPSSSRITVTAPSNTAGVGSYVLTLNRTGLASGQFIDNIDIVSNGGNITVSVQYEVPGVNQLTAGSVGELYVFLVNTETEQAVVQQVQSNAGEYDFRFLDVEPGVYYIIAGSDPDNDGFAGDVGEALGIYPTRDDPLLIIANKSFAELNFDATYEIPLEAATTSRAVSRQKGPRAPCQRSFQQGSSLPCVDLIRR